MPPIIEQSKCINCSTCLQICPLDVFRRDSSGQVVVRYPDECWHCRACVMDCPKEAVAIRYPLSHMMLTMPAVSKEGK